MHQPIDMRVTRILWAAAILLLAFVMAWPAIGGMIAVNDDIKFVRVPAHGEPVAKQIADAWRTSPSFRPLELMVAARCDERSLACPIAIVVQMAGLAMLAWGVVALARIVMPGQPWVAPIALIWIAMSPGTTCAAWQIDAGSQTWSAALGTWACVLCWRSFEVARAGRIAWGALATLTLVFALGVNIKETFYGWSAGIGVVALAATLWLFVRDRGAALRAAPTLVPVVALPIAHMAARWLTGAMSQSADANQDSRYQIELGMNLVINAVQSVAGAVGTGPFYLLADEKAPLALRALPALAGLVELCLLAAAVEFAVLRPAREKRLRWMPVALACVAGMISLSVTFPMGSVSELYGFGANVMIALLVGVALTALWRAAEVEDRGLTRTVAMVGGATALMVGLYGLAGRAHHFRNIWLCTRTANEQIVAFMDTRPAAPKYGDAPISTIYFPSSCRPERSYGAYITPVAQAVDILNTVDWMKRLQPRHPTTFSLDTDAPNHGAYDMVVGCDAMPRDGHW